MMGHWEHNHVVMSYINEMPFEVCLQRAGHPSNAQHYFLPRAQMSEEEKDEFKDLANAVWGCDVEELYDVKTLV